MARSEQIYQFIRDYIAEHGYAPTRREIASGCGIPSTRSVQDWLLSLAAAGMIRFDAKVSRSIVLVGADGPKPKAIHRPGG